MLRFALLLLLAMSGCTSANTQHQSWTQQPEEPSADAALAEHPVANLNRQIERFNAERPRDMGVFPIAERVSRVEHLAAQDIVKCFDQNGSAFLTLKRQEDGTFKGVLEVKFHEPFTPEKGSSWGYLLAEFFLSTTPAAPR